MELRQLALEPPLLIPVAAFVKESTGYLWKGLHHPDLCSPALPLPRPLGGEGVGREEGAPPPSLTFLSSENQKGELQNRRAGVLQSLEGLTWGEGEGAYQGLLPGPGAACGETAAAVRSLSAGKSSV